MGATEAGVGSSQTWPWCFGWGPCMPCVLCGPVVAFVSQELTPLGQSLLCRGAWWSSQASPCQRSPGWATMGPSWHVEALALIGELCPEQISASLGLFLHWKASSLFLRTRHELCL